MKKFWCFFLIALLLLGCAPVQEGPVTLVTPEPVTSAPTETPRPTATEAPTETPVPTEAPTETPAPTLSPEERLMRYVEEMSDEDKIGQLCMFGFTGTSEIDDPYAEILKTYRIGNVILFGQNMSRENADGGFSQCRALTEAAQKASGSKIPLLVSTDVEGGSVTRFRWKKSLNSARTLGKKNDADLAFEQFRYIGEGLLSAGINTDLAPCLDICKSPEESFLGKRIISSDADIAARIGRACVEGLHAGGCLSIIKHFPGHGATSADPHKVTPTIDRSMDALSRYELVPFEAALDVADGVMIAHIFYPSIDDAYIASQSAVFINDLLRGEYGYTGIVMSDDFRMDGLRKQASPEKAAVRFILIGGDMILCGTNPGCQKQILKGLYAAVEDGTISEDRLNESVYRILSAKMRVTDWDPFDGID